MMDMLLLVLVLGATVLAVGVDLGFVVGWCWICAVRKAVSANNSMEPSQVDTTEATP